MRTIMMSRITEDAANPEVHTGMLRKTVRHAILKSSSRRHQGAWMVSILFLLFVLTAPAGSTQTRINDDLFDVSFYTEKNGWACGRLGTIVHTSDGGESWIEQKSNTAFTLTSISFSDSSNGWAVGDGGIILHTSDGGKNWLKQKSPIDRYLMAVHFINNQKGWVVGEGTSILYTEDAGKTWTIQFQDVDFILKSISFCDAVNGWAVGEYGYIYHTRDAGRSWVQQAGYFGFSEETGDIQGGTFLFDVLAVNPSVCWAVGIDGCILKTVDGGKTWNTLGSQMPNTHLFAITSSSQGEIFVAGNGLLMTCGKDARFEPVKTQPTIKYGWLYSLAPKGEEGIVAVGRKGWVYQADRKEAMSLN